MFQKDPFDNSHNQQTGGDPNSQHNLSKENTSFNIVDEIFFVPDYPSIELVRAKFSPETVDTVLNHLDNDLRDLIYKTWSSPSDIKLFYNGVTTANLQTDRNFIKAHYDNNFAPCLRDINIMTQIQYDYPSDSYIVLTREGRFHLTKSEIAFAIRITPKEEGMIGICKNLALLDILYTNKYTRDKTELIDMIIRMSESPLVNGAESFFGRILGALSTDGLQYLTGVESEVRVAYDTFLRVRQANSSRRLGYDQFLHISRKIKHSEIDITVYRINERNHRLPTEMIETKTTFPFFFKKIFSPRGRNQMVAILQDCLKYSISPDTACPLKIYFTKTNTWDPRDIRIPRRAFNQIFEEDQIAQKTTRLIDKFLRWHTKNSIMHNRDPHIIPIHEALDLTFWHLREIFSTIKKEQNPNASIEVQFCFWNNLERRFEVLAKGRLL